MKKMKKEIKRAIEVLMTRKANAEQQRTGVSPGVCLKCYELTTEKEHICRK